MLLHLFLIQLGHSSLQIVSPDSLSSYSLSYLESPFGDPGLLPIFGQIVPTQTSDCMIPQASYSSFANTSIILVYDSPSCDYSLIALTAQDLGVMGIMFSLDSGEWSPTNVYSTPSVYANRGSVTTGISIFSLFVTSDFINIILQDYSETEIWVVYNKTNYAVSPAPTFKYFMASDYGIDNSFLSQVLTVIDNYENVWEQELEIFLLYSPNDNDPSNCLSVYNNNYCLPSVNGTSGAIRIANSVLILNFYKGISDYYDLHGFLSYVSDLNTDCAGDLSTGCNEALIRLYGQSPNYDFSVLKSAYDSSSMIYSMQVGDIFVYDPVFLVSAYLLSSTYVWTCAQSCTSMLYYSNLCNPECNNAECGFNNMVCLEENDCYSFMLHDGNCNEQCDSDPDCPNGEEHSMLVVKIAVPLIIGCIM
jgi:hypothetical protein